MWIRPSSQLPGEAHVCLRLAPTEAGVTIDRKYRCHWAHDVEEDTSGEAGKSGQKEALGKHLSWKESALVRWEPGDHLGPSQARHISNSKQVS